MSDRNSAQGNNDRSVYYTSMLWAVPVCFVLTLVVTSAALLVGQIGEPDFDALGAVFSGIILGVIIFFPTCFVSIPVVGLVIAGIRLFARSRKHRSGR